MSGSGISWAVCKSAPRFTQITTPAHQCSVFFSDQMPFLLPTNSIEALKARLKWFTCGVPDAALSSLASLKSIIFTFLLQVYSGFRETEALNEYFFTARVARMYRFCFVCVYLSGCQKLIISSLHHILHLPGGLDPFWQVRLSVWAWVSVLGSGLVAPPSSPAYPYPQQRRAVRLSLELILVNYRISLKIKSVGDILLLY